MVGKFLSMASFLEQVNKGSVAGVSQAPGACSSTTTHSCDSPAANPDLPMSVIGFSKGCVVLNQMLYELSRARENPELEHVVRRVTHMYWLDGGHNGGSNTWVTDEEVLNSLVGTGIQVRAHVTPYQMKDEMRNWIGQEHKKFVEYLRAIGVTVYDATHFANQDRSLENHFQVLTKF